MQMTEPNNKKWVLGFSFWCSYPLFCCRQEEHLTISGGKLACSLILQKNGSLNYLQNVIEFWLKTIDFLNPKCNKYLRV